MNPHQQMLMERVGEGILQAAEAEERRLDEKLQKMEHIDEDDLEYVRQKRRLEMQKKMKQEQDWRQLGHGRYYEINDPKEFFNAAKKSERMVAHFYRGVTPRCEILDAHFERLAAEHLETRFIKVNVEKCPFLVERLHIHVIPTVVLIRDGKTEHSLIGFNEFGGTDNFSTNTVAFVLSKYKVLNYEGDMSEDISRQKNSAGVNKMNISNIRSGGRYTLSDDEED